ncbi:MAG: hypothetical protein H7A24_15760 [Leptospiraceae bacterium]|nr:hypothetical protein [Leptospiraceae bacterium]
MRKNNNKNLPSQRNAVLRFANLLLFGIFFWMGLLHIPLVWDGAFHLFRVLDSGRVFPVHGRFSIALLHYPSILLSGFTDNLFLIKSLFSLGYTLIPVFSFLALLKILPKSRKSRNFLFLSFLGIFILPLPGQFFFVSESIFCVQLAWLFWGLLLIRDSLRKWISISVLGLFLFFAHPVSGPIFFLSGLILGLDLFFGLRKKSGFQMGLVFLFFLLFVLRFLYIQPGYETHEMERAQVMDNLEKALSGYAKVFLSGLFGFLALSLRFRPGRKFIFSIGIIFLFFLSGMGLINLSAVEWRYRISYRYLVFFTSLPIFGIFFYERYIPELRRYVSIPRRFSFFRHPFYEFLPIGAMAVVVFLGLQSFSYLKVRTLLERDLKGFQGCKDQSSLPYLGETIYYHWAFPYYTILLGKREVTRFFAVDIPCDTIYKTGKLQLHRLDREVGKGWFRFSKTIAEPKSKN